jgi:signal peptidase I
LIGWKPALTDSQPEPGLPPFATQPPPSTARAAAEIPILIVVAALIAFVVKTFIAQPFYIPSESMVPQLRVNDRVVVSKLAYHFHSPRRGDIVVFDNPDEATFPTAKRHYNPVIRVIRGIGSAVGLVQPSTEEFIKRVVGLPGETVEGHQGHVYVNGHLLIEPYLPDGVLTTDFQPVVVPAGDLWVMGDNRNNSRDSRFFGPIRRKTVVGRTIVRIWPPGHASFL